uniref:Phospholipase/carboxylesterase/thioesterase domain-containing protein n=1 Tax=Alexandrium monilatum TaxID=311494 RepID=A0A7S4V1C7_9DINO|mmetsp:Transcript_14249/g.44181  ORF Transcript_14249/g.44181 Transcript_14249/m.44181 type:complete len:149 (-) Transcript_14249:15-461(-)
MKGLDDRLLESCEGIEASRDTILELLAKEAAAVGHDRCVLAGFSQGGAMALFVGLQLPQRLAGVLSLSAYLPTPGTVSISQEALATPVLQCHGEADSMVAISTARATEQFLEAHGVQNRGFKAYSDLAHAVHDEELEDVADWLACVLP